MSPYSNATNFCGILCYRPDTRHTVDTQVEKVIFSDQYEMKCSSRSQKCTTKNVEKEEDNVEKVGEEEGKDGDGQGV